MSDPAGALVGRAALAACLTLFAAGPARAQRPLADPPSTPQFLARFDVHLMAAALAYDDQRFSWDTHWGGDLDLIDYVDGRLTFLADYQAVLGNEYQPFDPYQGNYTLAVSTSVRAGRTEYALVYHHVSRHLGDRPKTFGIVMNALMGRVLRRVDAGATTIDLRADGGKVVRRAFREYVDYTWLAAGDVIARRQVSPRLGMFGRVYGETYAVDAAVAQRGGQAGGRLEAGVRLSGRGAVIELFAGYERVIDADPVDRVSRHWAFAGFRALNR